MCNNSIEMSVKISLRIRKKKGSQDGRNSDNESKRIGSIEDNLAGEYDQLLKGPSPLPIPKQNVTICNWLNGEIHSYFNGQVIKLNHLK